MDSRKYEDEKANLLHTHRFKQFLNVSNLLHLIELLIVVALVSRSVISVLLTFSSNLLNHAVVFLVGNVIIVVCYALSRGTDDGSQSEKYDVKYSSLNQRRITEYASIGEYVTVTPIPVTEETSGEGKPNEESDCENDVIDTASGEEKPNGECDYENDVIKTASGEEKSNEERENDAVKETEIEVAIKQAVKQIERFRRTQSEKLKREISIKQLRRSVTAERSGLLVTSGEGNSSETVDELSNEEFQIAVESFIWKQQSFLKQEGMAENGN